MKRSQHSNSKKLTLRIGFTVFLLLFFMKAATAQVSHCEQEENVIRRDQCYLDNAKSVEDCEPIYSNLTKGECIEKNAQSLEDCLQIEKATTFQRKCIEKFLADLNDPSQCAPLPEKYQTECYANVTYNNYPEEISKCYELSSDYQDECIATYIKRKGIADPNYCSKIKTELQKECAYWASRNKYLDVSANKLKQGATKEECNQYQGEVKAGCVQFFNSVKTTSIFSLFGFGLIMSSVLVLLLPALLMAAIVIVIVVIVKRRRRKRTQITLEQPLKERGYADKARYFKSEKSNLKIIFAILALILISGTAYGSWRIWRDISEPQDYGLYQVSREHKKSAEFQVPDISTWKTYRNEEYGFEFKYPADYYLVQEGQDVLIENNQNDAGFAVILINNPLDLTPNEYVEDIKSKQNEPEALIVISSKSIQVNGIEGVDVDMTGPGAFRGRSVFFPVKHQDVNQIVNFQYHVNNLYYTFDGDEEAHNRYLEDGDAIVSSFKVNAEVEDQERKWQTYRNEEYGFALKYPSHLQPQNTLFPDGPFHSHVGDSIVMSFSDGEKDELMIAASARSLDGYMVQDLTQGVFYRFNQEEDRWISSVRGEITGDEPALLDTPFTAYGYGSWERACSWQGAVIPHPKSNVVLEIIYTSCVDEEQQLELSEPVPDLNSILSIFYFIDL